MSDHGFRLVQFIQPYLPAGAEVEMIAEPWQHPAAAYDEHLTRQHPEYSYYWYYLADAQWKAGMLPQALQSVRQAIALNGSYPSMDVLKQLEQEIVSGEQPSARAETLFPATVKTASGVKWGYIDKNGAMRLSPRYEYAYDFQNNGLARVQERQLVGLIDGSSRYVVRPVYDSISPFSEGRAVVTDRDGFKMIDQSGKIVTGKAYSYIAPLQNGRAMFYESQPDGQSLYGYLDAKGSEVIPAAYLDATDFNKDRAVVKLKENEYALIGKDGSKKAAYPYPSVGPLSEGLMSFQKEQGGKYGYLNEKGEIVVSPAYTYALPFKEGRAVVNTSDDYTSKYGLIDKKGQIIIQPGYNDIRQLGEQRLALGQAVDKEKPYLGSKFAIADLNGKRLSDFRYDSVEDFDKGLASATDTKMTFFIDRNGAKAQGYPSVSGSGVLVLKDGLIQANVDQRLSYLDRSGRVIWRQNTLIPLRPPYRVREEKYKPNIDYLVYYPQIEGMTNQQAQQRVNTELKTLSKVKPVPAHEQLDYMYSGDFNVAFFQRNLLVLELEGYNFPYGAAHGMPSRIYTHINLTDGRMYALKDLFKPGSNYVAELSAIVGRQIKEDPQYSYVFPDTYKGISPDQPFYVTGNALHLYFMPYDIAPYAAGFPTFTIPFAEIMNLIATEGSFWKSFHN